MIDATDKEVAEKQSASALQQGTSALYGHLPYGYTKEDMEAATRLQIWQEIMRQHRGESSPDAVKIAEDAAVIFKTLRG